MNSVGFGGRPKHAPTYPSKLEFSRCDLRLWIYTIVQGTPEHLEMLVEVEAGIKIGLLGGRRLSIWERGRGMGGCGGTGGGGMGDRNLPEH